MYQITGLFKSVRLFKNVESIVFLSCNCCFKYTELKSVVGNGYAAGPVSSDDRIKMNNNNKEV